MSDVRSAQSQIHSVLLCLSGLAIKKKADGQGVGFVGGGNKISRAASAGVSERCASLHLSRSGENVFPERTAGLFI